MFLQGFNSLGIIIFNLTLNIVPEIQVWIFMLLVSPRIQNVLTEFVHRSTSLLDVLFCIPAGCASARSRYKQHVPFHAQGHAVCIHICRGSKYLHRSGWLLVRSVAVQGCQSAMARMKLDPASCGHQMPFHVLYWRRAYGTAVSSFLLSQFTHPKWLVIALNVLAIGQLLVAEQVRATAAALVVYTPKAAQADIL